MRFIRHHGVLALLALCALSGWDSVAAALPPPGKPVPARTAPAPSAAAKGSDHTSIAAGNGPSHLIFDDARTLKFLIQHRADKGSGQAIAAILETYGMDAEAASKAPFLSQIPYFHVGVHRNVVTTRSPTLVRPEGAAMTGLFSASSVANAFGTLIATRFKQEAELLAVRRLALKILSFDREHAGQPLSAAFPKTTAYLEVLELPSDAAAPADLRIRDVDMNDWAVIQSSIKADMAALPDNAPAFLDSLYGKPGVSTSRYMTWLASHTARQVLKYGRDTSRVFDSTVDTSTAFRDKYRQYAMPAPVTDIDAGLRAFVVLSHMLLASSHSAHWHSAHELQELMGTCSPMNCDDEGLYLLLGLSYARDRTLYESLNSWLKANDLPTLGLGSPTAPPPALGRLRALIGAADLLADALEKVSRDVQDMPTPITDIAQAGPLVADFGTMSVAATDSLRAFVGEPADALADCDSFCQVKNRLTQATVDLSTLVDLVGDLQTKQYSTAIGEIVVYVERQSDSLPASGIDVGEFLRRQGPFFAAIAAAKTPNDLQVALENYALPAGSYTQQQAKGFSVTLNGFFGGATSAETLIGNLSGTGAPRTRPRLGLAAPVGVAFNFGQVAESAPSTAGFFDTGAWSLFVPIIDVGAVASWRLGSGGGNVPAITWQNIVAPGLYAVWSQRDSPFSVLLGAQYGPELRKISTTGNTTIDKPAVQFPCIEFTFNIPIFNLYP